MPATVGAMTVEATAMTTETRQRENFRRFLADIRATPQERSDADAVQDLVESIDEGAATERVWYPRNMVALERDFDHGARVGLWKCQTDDLKWWTRYDGCTAWDEVEGPQ